MIHKEFSGVNLKYESFCYKMKLNIVQKMTHSRKFLIYLPVCTFGKPSIKINLTELDI